MATQFRNTIINSVGTTPVRIYTTPENFNTTVIGMSLANLTAGIVTAGVYLQDTPNDSATGYYIKDVSVAPNSSLRLVTSGEKLIIPEYNELFIVSNTTASLDVIMSYVEIA